MALRSARVPKTCRHAVGAVGSQGLPAMMKLCLLAMTLAQAAKVRMKREDPCPKGLTNRLTGSERVVVWTCCIAIKALNFVL